MNYSLNPYSLPLSSQQAAHLLRRATMGATHTEIASFTGLTAQQAIQNLVDNVNYNIGQPVDIRYTSTTVGQVYANFVYDSDRDNDFKNFNKNWWINQMANQGGSVSIHHKLILFWQNHFVTTVDGVNDFRAVVRYFTLIRASVLGNMIDFVRAISLDPSMLVYLNGRDNQKTKPNENFGRELMELFVVGAKDYAGNNNYTENDVKEAARVLTGWQVPNYKSTTSTTVDYAFTLSRHDILPKQFSLSYPNPNNPSQGNTITTPITIPVGYNNVGEYELDELLNMLFRHPETPKYICRKLYRFFVNPNVTPDIEANIIGPLSDLFKTNDPSTGRPFEIKPILLKLLASEHFYDAANIGAMVKSPVEFLVGTFRFFNFQVPVIEPIGSANFTSSIRNYKAYADYLLNGFGPNNAGTISMQMDLLDQPTVFGYDAYYQAGYTRNWINTTQIGLRNSFIDTLFTGRTLVSGITPLVVIKIDTVTMVDLPTTATPYYNANDCVAIFDLLVKNLFATSISQSQKDFLIDTIMMQNLPRTSWTFEWDAFKAATPGTTNHTTRRNAVKGRLDNLLKFMLKMAEYHIC